MLKKPKFIDFFVLSCFTALITFHPYFLHGKINLFELGIYLPGINAILDGSIPYRDFFHLRGPFELYMPAFIMSVWGEEMRILSGFFYFGTVLTLILCVLIGLGIYRTRLMLYLMVPVLVARTFPRVVFTYWGGIRFAFGLLAIYFMIQYFKRNKGIWLLWAGVASSCAALTSVDVGICAFGASLGSLFIMFLLNMKEKRQIIMSSLIYLLGFLIIIVPYLFYLSLNQALMPFLDSLGNVVFNMQNVFNMHFASHIPNSPWEAILAIFNPTSKNFKHMTPAYLYIFLSGFFIYKIKRREFYRSTLGILALGIYGLILYFLAFRNIEAAQFEMALQPEKILLFYLLEETYLFLRDKKTKLVPKFPKRASMINVLFLLLILSSVGYPIQRFNHRFYPFQYVRNKIIGKETDNLKPLAQVPNTVLKMRRVKGFVVPTTQADDFREIKRFLQKETSFNEPVLMFPELGTYHFIIDRPFIGRFPMVTFSWLSDQWHEELMSDLKETRPKFAIVEKEPGHWFQETYFRLKKNKEKYDEVLDYVQNNYRLIRSTPSLHIYQLK